MFAVHKRDAPAKCYGSAFPRVFAFGDLRHHVFPKQALRQAMIPKKEVRVRGHFLLRALVRNQLEAKVKGQTAESEELAHVGDVLRK